MSATIEQNAPLPAPESDVHEIRGDVGAAGGDVHHHGDLRVGSNIRDGMVVEVSGALTVGGSIEAAEVRVGKSITVAGSIVGRGKGRCFSGATISVKVANGANLEANEDITGAVEIVSCRIIAGGALRCENAQLYGGHITANGGVVCAVLGSPAGMETLVEAGIDERLRRLGETRAPEIDRDRRKIYKVRSEIVPLLSNQKALTARQKETATELLYDANELEEKTRKLLGDLRRLVAALHARAKPEIIVNKTLHAGVTIRFSNVTTRITETIEGPLKISLKSLGNSGQIVLTKLERNSVQQLKTAEFTDPHLEALYHAIAAENEPTFFNDHSGA